MFISEDIPQSFNYIAEYSDNYVVLVNTAFLRSGVSYEAYIQYFTPSLLVVHLDDYYIKNGDSYNLDVNYINNGIYSYIDNIDYSYSLNCSELDDRVSGYYDRPDLPNVLFVQFLCVFLFVWVLNQLSKFVHKGGVFGG